MNAGIQRRLAKLENGGGAANGLGDLAATIEAGRKRVQTMTQEEIRVGQRARLAEQQRRHAEHPLRGVELRLMQGLARVLAADAAEAAA